MVFVRSLHDDDEFDTSDEEDGPADDTPLSLDWLTLPCNQLDNQPISNRLYTIGICSMPGRLIGGVRRSMVIDLDFLKREGVQDIFVLSNHVDLKRCHAVDLLYQYDRRGFTVHYYPTDQVVCTDVTKCLDILHEIEACLRAGHKTILQCVDGLGKSCTMAGVLWLFLDSNVTPLGVMASLCQLRGPMAIERVKQYNYLTDFRKNVSLVLAANNNI